MDDAGRIVREVRVASEPDALLAVLTTPPATSSVLDWKLGRCRNGCRARVTALAEDAGNALRSGPYHAGAFGKMVMAKGLGDENCEAPPPEEGD